jgi:hypothetical protein
MTLKHLLFRWLVVNVWPKTLVLRECWIVVPHLLLEDRVGLNLPSFGLCSRRYGWFIDLLHGVKQSHGCRCVIGQLCGMVSGGSGRMADGRGLRNQCTGRTSSDNFMMPV